MASEALQSNWKIFFKSLDTNHDGVLSHKDVEFTRERFSELHHLDETKRKLAIEKFENYWEKYILKGRTNDISESEFVQALNEDYKRDGKQVFDANMSSTMNTALSILNDECDVGAEKFLTKDEFIMAYTAYGHEKIANDPATFQAFNPVNGRILLQDIIDAWVQLLTDGSEGSIRKQFESHGFL